jgi:hypothetical protein
MTWSTPVGLVVRRESIVEGFRDSEVQEFQNPRHAPSNP